MHKILIVEDELLMREILVDRFSKESEFQVFSSNNGEDGLRNAIANHPDIILLDILMPVMDGITMMKELRKDENSKDIKIIFLTNLEPEDNILKEISDGRSAFYLIKANIDVDDIVRKVKESLDIRQ